MSKIAPVTVNNLDDLRPGDIVQFTWKREDQPGHRRATYRIVDSAADRVNYWEDVTVADLQVMLDGRSGGILKVWRRTADETPGVVGILEDGRPVIRTSAGWHTGTVLLANPGMVYPATVLRSPDER